MSRKVRLTYNMRQLFITEEITPKNVKDTIKSLVTLISYDDEQDNLLNDYKREAIDIFIDSCGGDLYSSIGIAEVIRKSKTPINTICLGCAFSGAFIILISGHNRVAYPMSSMMFHQLSHGLWSNLQAMKTTVEWDTKVKDMVDSFVVEQTKIKKQDLVNCNSQQKDWYMNAEEALKLGVIDKILEK